MYGAEVELLPVEIADRVTLVARLGAPGELAPGLPAADAARLQESYLERLARVALQRGGVIGSRERGRLVVTFGAPPAPGDRVGGALDPGAGSAAELGSGAGFLDDPVRALRAALEMVEQMAAAGRDLGRPVPVRIGVCSGPRHPAVTEPEVSPFGTRDAVELASHLEHPCASGSIVCTYAIHREVRGLFEVRPLDPMPVRGRGQPVPLYEVLRERPDGVRLPTRPVLSVETRLWGREAELKQLKRLLDDACSSGKPRGALLHGELGLGKTRLCHELARYLDTLGHGSTLLWARCTRESRPCGVIVEPLLRHAGLTELRPADAHKAREGRGHFRAFLSELLMDRRLHGRRADDTAPSPPREEELAQVSEQVGLLGFLSGLAFDDDRAVRACGGDAKLLFGRAADAALAWIDALLRRGPVLLVVEDVHLADAASLRLLEHMYDRARGPLLIVGTSSSFVAPPGLRGRLQPVVLAPLDDDASVQLVEQVVLVRGRGAESLRDRVVQLGGGNPLLLEELLVQAVELPDAELRPDLTALLAARFERMSRTERATLARAAALGHVFDPLLLDEPAWQLALRRLFQRGLLCGADEVRRGAARFRHPLLREVLLVQLTAAPRAERTAIHGWAAGALARHGWNGVAVPEQVGRLHAAAGELEPALGQAAHAVAVAAARGSVDICNRVLAWALPLTRSTAPTGDDESEPASARIASTAQRAELFERAAETALVAGDLEAAASHLEELASIVTRLGERGASARLALLQARLALARSGLGRALELARSAVASAELAQEESLLLAALNTEGRILARQGAFAEACERHETARSLAERLGDRHRALEARLLGALTRARSHLDEGVAAELEATARTARDLGEDLRLLESLAGLVHAWRRLGRRQRALEATEEALAVATRLGHRRGAIGVLLAEVEVHRAAGQLRPAVAALARAAELMDELDGDEPELGTLRRDLDLCRVRLMLWRGEPRDLTVVEQTCDRLAAAAREGGNPDLLAAALTELAHAVQLRGGLARASRLSAEALSLVAPSRTPADLAVAIHLRHAEVLRASGDEDAARAVLGQARELLSAEASRLATPEARAAYLGQWEGSLGSWAAEPS